MEGKGKKGKPATRSTGHRGVRPKRIPRERPSCGANPECGDLLNERFFDVFKARSGSQLDLHPKSDRSVESTNLKR